MKDQPAVIGTSLCRADGPSKARGLEKYAADYYPSGLLWAGVKLSEHPRPDQED